MDSELRWFVKLLHEHTVKPNAKTLRKELPDVKILCSLCKLHLKNGHRHDDRLETDSLLPIAGNGKKVVVRTIAYRLRMDESIIRSTFEGSTCRPAHTGRYYY